jgi:type I restriction enzyme S subunit
MARKVANAAPPSPTSANRNLPKGWRIVRFGDVVRDVNESERNPLAAGLERFIGLEHIEPENLHLKRWGLLADGEISFTKRFRRGQVLFGKRRAYQRKVAVAEFDGICSSDILTFEPKGDALFPELLPFIVQSDGFFEHALGTSSGSLSPRTRWSQLQDYEFPLPPKDEQRRIADILCAADAVSEKHLAGCQTVKSLIDAMTLEFLRGQWPVVECEDLFVQDPRNGFSPNCNSDTIGFPTLAIGAVRDGKIIPDGNIKYAEISERHFEQFKLYRGDVLVVRGNGNRALCGKCGIVESLPDNCFYPDLLIRLTFDANIITPEFAVLQWNTTQVHNRLLQCAKSTNGIWKINGKDIRQHKLAVPPLDAQNQFLKQIALPQQAALRAFDAHKTTEQLKHRVLNDIIEGNANVQ